MTDAFLSRGDSSGAAAMLAKVFVDPSTPEKTAAEVAARGRPLVGGPDWERRVPAARGEMHRRTVAEAGTRRLGAEDVDLMDAEGQSHRLHDLVTGQVTLVVLSTRYCERCLNELAGLGGLLRHIRHYDDVNAMLIFAEAGEMQDAVAEVGLDIPVYYDTERAAQQALNAWDAPDYFVLDRLGQVRFSANSFEEVVRQVEALRATEGA
jgi:peroxiredoxin